ncbi:chaperonin-containing T-complex eta subunit Cct7 [Desmophyllum pertusum]|uniref:Chaperonin-containing T-complex eta subunit Cct7 n=1 Tax=Desmophyllum pertusum TaxID=174260 RepID=A0A9X0D7L1_9CNID|nr:chaperonin-containing T-complex eta subunit Cct7 [Desmophyllum pertusum]
MCSADVNCLERSRWVERGITYSPVALKPRLALSSCEAELNCSLKKQKDPHDAIMIVRRAIKNDAVVAGGGAIEMELSKFLRDYSRSIAGKEQLLIGAMARALEIIPRQLCDNAGFDATNILNKLRQRHFQGGMWYGVDINNEDIADNFEAFVWEPSVVKINAITAATEAACLILSVDETVKNPKSGGDGPPPGAMGRGRGRPR